MFRHLPDLLRLTKPTWVAGNATSTRARKLNAGRGTVGKTAVVGAKDRKTNKIKAKVFENTDARTLQKCCRDSGQRRDGLHGRCSGLGMPFEHESVCHSVGEYVKEMAHTNGIESFWSMLKRAHKGVYHKISAKHLQRYVDEFAGRHGIRERDTLNQMDAVVAGMVGKRSMYRDNRGNNHPAQSLPDAGRLDGRHLSRNPSTASVLEERTMTDCIYPFCSSVLGSIRCFLCLVACCLAVTSPQSGQQTNK